MTQQHAADERDIFARRYEYDDETVIAADLGVTADDASVDIVDDTVIVVIETDEEARQEEFDLPGEDARAFIRNGVLTIEVNA